MSKFTVSVKSLMASILLAIIFTAAQPALIHAQNAVIPECPSVDEFPKPECFDLEDEQETSKEKLDDKAEEKAKKEETKS